MEFWSMMHIRLIYQPSLFDLFKDIIECSCLAAHSTNLWQSLKVGRFGLLKQNYQKLLAEKTQFTMDNINKTDFISFIQKSQKQGILLFEIYSQRDKL